jgi:hypothetical protein
MYGVRVSNTGYLPGASGRQMSDASRTPSRSGIITP